MNARRLIRGALAGAAAVSLTFSYAFAIIAMGISAAIPKDRGHQ